MSIYLNKVIVKKTKVQVVLDSQITSYQNTKECFNELIIKSLITGASANCLKQISKAGVENEEFKAIKEAQQKFNKIYCELERKLSLITDNSCPSTHTFY